MFELDFYSEAHYASTKEDVFHEIDNYLSKLPKNTHASLIISNSKQEGLQTIVGGEYSRIILYKDSDPSIWIEKDKDDESYTPELLWYESVGDGSEIGAPYIITWEKSLEYIHKFLDESEA